LSVHWLCKRSGPVWSCFTLTSILWVIW
jgi:hypothetical protein